MRSDVIDVGLRRMAFVRIDFGSVPPRCEVVGTAHRLPVTVPLAPATASALVRAGVPLVLRATAGAHRLGGGAAGSANGPLRSCLVETVAAAAVR